MSEPPAQPSGLWSDDALWAASTIHFPVLFLDAQRRVHRANPAAQALAAKLVGDGHPESLVALVGDEQWATALREGYWKGIVRPDPQHPLALEIHCGQSQDSAHCLMVVLTS